MTEAYFTKRIEGAQRWTSPVKIMFPTGDRSAPSLSFSLGDRTVRVLHGGCPHEVVVYNNEESDVLARLKPDGGIRDRFEYQGFLGGKPCTYRIYHGSKRKRAYASKA